MRGKPKIAMFFSSDSSAAGGVQEHVLGLSKALFKRGYKLATFGSKNSRPPFVNYHEVGRTINVPTPNGNWGYILIGDENSDNLVKKINTSFDIFHIQEPYLPFLGWKLLKEVKIPCVVTFHTAWEDKSILNILNPVVPMFSDLFSNIKAAVYVSDVTRKRWESACNRDAVVRVIPNGVDLGLFTPKLRKRSLQVVKLLFVGRIVRRKGLHFLLRAIKKLVKKRQDFKLTVLGDGPEMKKLKIYVKKNSLGKFVIFKGEILGKARVKYFQEADVFCAPYVDEAFGIAILEAMACGLAIVGFKIAAFGESLKDYPGLDLLVPQKNVNRLARSLEKIINDKDFRIELGRWVIKESKKYGWEKIANETEKIYRALLKR